MGLMMGAGMGMLFERQISFRNCMSGTLISSYDLGDVI